MHVIAYMLPDRNKKSKLEERSETKRIRFFEFFQNSSDLRRGVEEKRL